MRSFLTAEWRYLLMLNYAVEPDLLRPHVPAGVELDSWRGVTYVSLVGFLFQRTRVFGLWLPRHSNFEEVNLRFYVRKQTPDGWRRGVVFIKEIVPRQLIATVARLCYNEPYDALPMRHDLELENGRLKNGGSVKYSWRFHGRWNFLSARTVGRPQPLEPGSQEEFITEHYWGYTAQQNGSCKEYQVNHPRWDITQVADPVFDCDAGALYGQKFKAPLSSAPQSAFVAEGSPVTVGTGKRL